MNQNTSLFSSITAMEETPTKVLEKKLDVTSISNSIESPSNTDNFEYYPDDIDLLAKPLLIEPKYLFKDLFKRRDKINGDAIATQLSVFEDLDPSIARKYLPPRKYENYKNFDPYLRWTVDEEKKAIRKTDWKILTMVSFMFFALNLDRGNLAQAISGGFLEDIKLSTDDYNLGNTINLVAFIAGEIPSQLIGKRFGPDKWIPIQVMLWLIVAGAQFWVNGRTSFLVTRVLVGLLQSGFIADAVAYINLFYTRKELSTRLAFFWLTNCYASIISSLLSIGFLKVNLHGMPSWKWLFLFDGIISFFVGVFAFIFMVPGPSQTQKFFNTLGYYTKKEEKIIVNRLLRDDPTKSDMGNREAISFKQFVRTISDFDLWPLYIVAFFFDIGVFPTAAYKSINLRLLGFSTTQINLLTIPIEVFNAINMVLLAWFSDYFNERAFFCLFTQVWMLICIVIEYTAAHKLSPWSQYVMMFFIIGFPKCQAIIVAWTSGVAYSVRARTIAAPISNIGVQLAGILGSNLYRSDDAPYYRRGNRQLIAIVTTSCVLFLLTKAYYIFRNVVKSSKWNAMSNEEKELYLNEHRDDGNKRIDFLFPH